MSELPPTWTSTTLGLVSQITTGNTPSTKISSYFGGSHPFVKPGDLDRRLPIVETVQTLSDAGAANARLVRPGAVLVSCIGNLGKIGIAGKPLATNQQINAVEFHASMIDDRYGYYYCCTLKTWMEQSSSATTVAILNKGRFSLAPIDVAPLAEQKRIANQLDTLLARVQACNDRFDAIPALLKRFRQTVLVTAHAGDLTEDWRVDHGHELVEVTTLGSVLKVSSGNFLPAKDMAPNGKIPVFGGNGVNGYHDHGNVQEKTLVIGRVGFYCGSIHLTPNSAWVTDNALIVRHHPSQTNREYLHYALKAVDLRVNDSSTAQPVISGQKIYPLPLRVPSMAEQLEIVRRIDALFILADRIEARCTAARTQAQRLTPLVLAKAFRGELVPQDPNDEPASALLARLSTQRGETDTPAKTRQPSKPRTVVAIKERTIMTKSRQDDDVKGKPYLSDHLRRIGTPATAEALFKVAQLPVADFYKQLAWEVDQGLVKDSKELLEPSNAA